MPAKQHLALAVANKEPEVVSAKGVDWFLVGDRWDASLSQDRPDTFEVDERHGKLVMRMIEVDLVSLDPSGLLVLSLSVTKRTKTIVILDRRQLHHRSPTTMRVRDESHLEVEQLVAVRTHVK